MYWKILPHLPRYFSSFEFKERVFQLVSFRILFFVFCCFFFLGGGLIFRRVTCSVFSVWARVRLQVSQQAVQAHGGRDLQGGHPGGTSLHRQLPADVQVTDFLWRGQHYHSRHPLRQPATSARLSSRVPAAATLLSSWRRRQWCWGDHGRVGVLRPSEGHPAA